MTSIKNKFLEFYEKYMILIGSFGHSIFVFQTYEILKQSSAENISFGGFFIAFISIISWLVYGILTKDKVLTIVNIFGVIASSICLIAILIHK